MSEIILDLCGGTGSWSLPYKEAGYDVRVITIPEYDVRTFVLPDEPIYGILAAPPCTMFSYARTRAIEPRDLGEGMEIVVACLKLIWDAQNRLDSDQQRYSPLRFWALENPYYGMLKWFLGKPTFDFDPWEFGDAYKKRTAIWGYFKEPVKIHKSITEVMTPEQVEEYKTNSQVLPKYGSKDILPECFRKLDIKARRSVTPRGFAQAFFKANSPAVVELSDLH